MKTVLSLLCSALLGLASAGAQNDMQGISAENPRMTRNKDFMAVEMTLRLDGLAVPSNRAVLITPRIVNGADSADLPSIGIYGRRRYYFYVRNGESMLTAGETSLRAAERPDTLPYRVLTAYADWMEGSRLELHRYDFGCCGSLLDNRSATLISCFRNDVEPAPYMPGLVYVQPQAEKVKTRSLSGTAYIDFPVNRTEIRTDFRNNAAELQKIHSTIDSIRSDSDIRVTSIAIKGFASPESPYANNARLARGRTEALRSYVEQLYQFPKGFIATSFEPEDWAGLRDYVDRSDLMHRKEILALIDSPADPDAKERKIKASYPEDYRLLLTHCYPALRHSDYRIEYIIRSFSDVGEIERILHTRPQKLSLQEFYLLAQMLDAGSEAFNNVFETAVRMYPDDPAANLNAANTALLRNDLKTARHYLERAGSLPQTVYARGVCALLEKDYPLAVNLMKEALKQGIGQAEDVLKYLEPYNPENE